MATINTGALINRNEDIDVPRFRTLGQWLEWQEGLHFTAIDLGLDRCRSVAEKMGLLEHDFTVISVAGTNGKGSSVTLLDMVLRRSGYRTGIQNLLPPLVFPNRRLLYRGYPYR